MSNKSQKSNTHRQVDQLFENVSGLIETQLQLFQLEARAEISKLLGAILVLTLLAFVSGMVILGLSIGLTIFLGQLFDSILYAVLLITLVYLIVFVWLWLSKDSIKETLTASIELQLDKLSLNAMGKEEDTSQELVPNPIQSPKNIDQDE